MTNDIDTLATALYVKTDDLLKQFPDLAPWRPQSGLQPQLADAELVTLAVMQPQRGLAPRSGGARRSDYQIPLAYADDYGDRGLTELL